MNLYSVQVEGKNSFTMHTSTHVFYVQAQDFNIAARKARRKMRSNDYKRPKVTSIVFLTHEVL